jgi:hypothetical protein
LPWQQVPSGRFKEGDMEYQVNVHSSRYIELVGIFSDFLDDGEGSVVAVVKLVGRAVGA